MIVGLSHSIKNLARVLNESDSPMPSEEIRDSLVLTNQEFNLHYAPVIARLQTLGCMEHTNQGYRFAS